MSWQATSWVLQHSEAEHGARLVALVLADAAHADGTRAFLSYETIMALAKLSRGAVAKALKDLEALGEIERAGKRPRGTIIWNLPGVQKLNSPPARGPESVHDPSLLSKGYEKDISKGGKELKTSTGLKIDGLVVTPEELELGSGALDSYNAATGQRLTAINSRGRPTPHLTMIVCRIRDYPEMTLEDHDRTIRNNVDNPWWQDGTTVGVIYGPRAFPRALTNEGNSGRPADGRTFKGERRTSEEDAPF